MVDTVEGGALAEEHLRRVHFVTDSALSSLTVESLLDELLTRIREVLRADTAAVLLLDESKAELVATRAKGIEEEVEQGVRLPVGAGFAGKIAATAQPVILDSVDHGKVLNPLLLRRGIRSMLGVPLVVAGSVIGVLHVGTLRPRKFTPDDVQLLQLVGDRLALAVHARHQQQHRVVAETLQRSLLPDRLPRMGDLETAGLYRPAEGGMVGGDWYDVFALGPDAVWIVVGDIAGRGLPAAIAMARLRNAARAMAFIDRTPVATLSHLNEFMLHFDPSVMATMLIGAVRTDGTMTYASAGHVPPVLVDPTGHAQLLDEPGEPPLGALTLLHYRERSLRLEPGSTLVLYTDGLVERRGQSLECGLEALRRATETEWSNLETLCSTLLPADSADPGLTDDVAVLTVHLGREGLHDPLRRTMAADPRELAPMRAYLARWLERWNAPPQDVMDVLVASGEAITNAVEHAYGPGRGMIDVDARMEGATVEVVVHDRGVWRPPRGTERGRGRGIMAGLMDEVVVASDEAGTTVTMRKRLDLP